MRSRRDCGASTAVHLGRYQTYSESMVRRPWPIILLALAHILAPVANIVLAANLLELSLWEYLNKVLLNSPAWKVAAQFVLLPIAGIAIYATKRWSYYVFVLTMAALVYLNYREQENHPHDFSFEFFIATTIFNILIVSYFLIPRVSKIYHNRRLRWWEQKPRYDANAVASLKILDQTHDILVENISETGAKIDPKGLEVLSSDVLTLNLNSAPIPFSLEFEVVHSFSGKWGVRFNHNIKTRMMLKKYISYLIENGAQSRTPIPHWTESLVEWIKTVFKTGKGIVPDEESRR